MSTPSCRMVKMSNFTFKIVVLIMLMMGGPIYLINILGFCGQHFFVPPNIFLNSINCYLLFLLAGKNNAQGEKKHCLLRIFDLHYKVQNKLLYTFINNSLIHYFRFN